MLHRHNWFVVVTATLTTALAILSAAGCGGGSDAAQSAPSGTTMATPPGTPATVQLDLDVNEATTTVAVSGYSAELTVPASTSTAGTKVSVSVSTTLPAGLAAMSGATTLLYLTLAPTADVAFANFPALAVTVPADVTLDSTVSLAYYDPATKSWTDFGNVSAGNSTLSFSGFPETLTWSAGKTYVFALYRTQADGLASGTLVVSDIPSIDDTLALTVTGMPSIRAFNLTSSICITSGADSTGLPLKTCSMANIAAPLGSEVEFSGGTWSASSGFPPIYDACYEAKQNITVAGYTVNAQDASSPGCSTYAATPDDMAPPADALCITIPEAVVVPDSDNPHAMACSGPAAGGDSINNGIVEAYVCNHAGASSDYQKNTPCPNGIGAAFAAGIQYSLTGGGNYAGRVAVVDDGSIQSTYNTAAPGCEDGETFANPIKITPRTVTGAPASFTVTAQGLSSGFSGLGNQCAVVFLADSGEYVVLYLYMYD
jgi:hypothetical protein